MSKIINHNEYGNKAINKEVTKLILKTIQTKKLFRYASSNSICDKLELKMSTYLGAKDTVLVMNGTAGLRTALLALGVKQGDFVLISAFTFIATASAVISTGAIPIPVDFHPETGLDCDYLNQLIKQFKPKVIIPVHWPGLCFNISKIIDIAHQNKSFILEDACQAFGANQKNKMAGLWGDIGVYSFQQNKQISSGDGGCIVSNNEDLINRCKKIVDHGAIRNKNNFPIWEEDSMVIGENLRMTEMQASILLPQLSKINEIIDSQKNSKNRIIKACKKEDIQEYIFNKHDTGMTFRILFETPKQAELAIASAKEQGILLKSLWTKLFYEYPAMRNFKLKDCPKALEIARQMLILPIPPFLSVDSVDKLIEFLFSIKKNLKTNLSSFLKN